MTNHYRMFEMEESKMRILKKFFLAAGLVGLIGSVGFAKEAKAAPTVEVSVDFDAASGTADLTWRNTDADDEFDYLEKAVIKQGSVTLDTLTLTEEGTSQGILTEEFPVVKLINSKVDSFSASSLKAEGLTVTVTGVIDGTEKTTLEVPATMVVETDYVLYRVEGSTDPEGAGTLSVQDMDSTTFYSLKDATYNFKQVPKSGYNFKGWTVGGEAKGTAAIVSVKVDGFGEVSVVANYEGTEPTPTPTPTPSPTPTAGPTPTPTAGPTPTPTAGPTPTPTAGPTPTPAPSATISIQAGKSSSSMSTAAMTVASSEKIYAKATVNVSGIDNYYIGWGYKTSRTSNSITPISNVTGENVEIAASSLPTNSTVYLIGYVATSNPTTIVKSSDTIEVKTINQAKVETKDFTAFVTKDYEMEFTASVKDDSGASIEWEVSDGKDYAELSVSDNGKKVKVKGKGDIDAGSSKEVKLKAKVNGEYAKIDSDDTKVVEKKLEVYSKPTLKYDNRALKYKAPKKVFTGTTDGKDSSNTGSTKTEISEVKGVRLQVLLDGTSLGTTTTASSKGAGSDEYTIDASTVENIIKNLAESNKFSKTCNVVFRAYPSDSSGNYNKNVYDEVEAKVYEIVINVAGGSTKSTTTKSGAGTASAYALPVAAISPAGSTVATSTTTSAGKTYKFYGLEGQEIDVSSILTSERATAFGSLTNGVADRATSKSVVVSSTESQNTYTAVLGERVASSSSGAGYDAVPKTGENNTVVFMMMLVVVAAVCAGLYVYNKKSKENI